MALPFLKQKEKKSLGIDIGTSSIKVVELEKSGDKIELSNYGEYEGSADVAFHSSSIKLLSSQVADIIKAILQETGISSREATISIPVFSGFSTTISMPKMSEAELAQAVSFEAKKYIPLPLSEVQFEWVPLKEQIDTDARRINTDASSAKIPPSLKASEGQGSNKSAGIRSKETRILIVAVTNELINRYHEIAKLSGVKLKYLELETFSLARSLASESRIAADSKPITADSSSAKNRHIGQRESSALIIDIGSRGTILSVVRGGWPVFTRNLDVSGFEFSKVLARSLGIDFKRAEALKKTKGISRDGGALIPLIDNILMEGQRLIDEYTKRSNISVSRIILSGGSARMPGLLGYVVKRLGREAVMGFPFRGIIYPKELEGALRELGPSFGVAVGVALRSAGYEHKSS